MAADEASGQRGLAGPGRADESEDLPGPHLE